ncbi:unnamed protein product [Brassicogethes aeneus]|nr:unnamed protein product [Brassicogethes aeneus]
MVIMDSYYAPNHLHEIWNNINKYHLIYLEMEESPEKLEQRIKLEDCIKDYLCNASHTQKFVYPQTAEILERSASHKKDFSGYKAANGWNAIQMYAGNLLSQPWRKEYRQIKTYSGFYKHQIQANLDGAEIMFEAMGYKHDGHEVLVLEGPVCPDTVANVSKDCLIAYVECQILKMIWEEVASSGYKVTWQDVLDFRKSHLCSPEQSIKTLKYRQQQKHYQTQEHSRSYSQGSDMLKQTPAHVLNHSFPPLTAAHHHLPIGAPPYGYAGNCCAAYAPHYAHTNGYGAYSSNGYIAHQAPAYYYPVPTAQLIEVENGGGGSYDAVDGRQRYHRVQDALPPIQHPPTKNKPPSSTDKEDSSQFEDWDYVYRNLESQGYSKDLGERGDLLSPSGRRRFSGALHKKVKTSDLDELMQNFAIREDKFEQERKPQQDRHSSQGSSYENMPNPTAHHTEIKKNSNTYAKPLTKSLAKEKIPPIKEATLIGSKTSEARGGAGGGRAKEEKKVQAQPQANSIEGKESSWQCRACTYLNERQRDICEMCSKTRKACGGGNAGGGADEDMKMEIGGAECKKCTLVNPKDSRACQACGASLKNSATYI